MSDGSPSSAAGALTDYTVAFKTSATGELSEAAGSSITIELPSGTEFEGGVYGVVTDTTTRQSVGGSCSVLVSAVTEVTCPVTGSVAPENTVSVELDHVVNPGTAGSGETVEVWTTSDTAHARSTPYTVSPRRPDEPADGHQQLAVLGSGGADGLHDRLRDLRRPAAFRAQAEARITIVLPTGYGTRISSRAPR